MILDSAVDRFEAFIKPHGYAYSQFFLDRQLNAHATSSIAHFSTPLDIVVSPSNMKVASSSRLARGAEKCTLEPVQLRNLG
jgi:lactam utilization protein B